VQRGFFLRVYDRFVALKDRIYDRIRLGSLKRKVRLLGTWLGNHELQLRKVPHGSSMLVLAPHQDDESIGCGGTIKLATAQGGRVDVTYTADGRRGFAGMHSPTEEECAALVETRKREAREACAVLGVSEVTFLGGEDSMLHMHTHLWRNVLTQLESRHYGFLLTPWPVDQHRDHQSTWKIAALALEHYANPIEVWFYEVWTPLLPNIAVDITSTADAKREAVQKFESQLKAFDYVETSLGLARYRSALVAGARYAEVFLGGDKEFAMSLWKTKRAFF
jgi:LmbE family N-acetylglucosaminyl deacetylase